MNDVRYRHLPGHAALLQKTLVALVVFAAPVAAWAQSGEGVAPSGQIVKLMAGLAVIVGAIVLLSFVLKRAGGSWAGGGHADFRVLSSLALGSRERIVLLQAGEHQLLIGVAPGNVRMLHQFDTPVLQAPMSQNGGAFHQRLLDAFGRRTPGI